MPSLNPKLFTQLRLVTFSAGLVLPLLLLPACRSPENFHPSTTSLPDQTKWITLRTEWREASSFISLSEYFQGEEAATRETVLRSDPSQSDGFYWQVRLTLAEPPTPDLQFHIDWIEAATPEIQTTFFPIPAKWVLPRSQEMITLGLTHGRFQENDYRPLAWRLRIVDENGKTLTQKNSFLWSDQPALSAN